MTRNEEFELSDGSYSVSDIPNDCEYKPKKHGEKTANPSIRIYVNKIELHLKQRQAITSNFYPLNQ